MKFNYEQLTLLSMKFFLDKYWITITHFFFNEQMINLIKWTYWKLFKNVCLIELIISAVAHMYCKFVIAIVFENNLLHKIYFRFNCE